MVCRSRRYGDINIKSNQIKKKGVDMEEWARFRINGLSPIHGADNFKRSCPMVVLDGEYSRYVLSRGKSITEGRFSGGRTDRWGDLYPTIHQ